MEQMILSADHDYRALKDYLSALHVKRAFLVCGHSGEWFDRLLRRMGIETVLFSAFRPNPAYESAVEGTQLFQKSGGQLIAAVGGGSAMDVAKCIRLWCNQPDTPFLAVPTTAGTGSEATRFAVVYRHGQKQSIDSELCIPNAVLFDPGTLKTLPEYHRKSSMLDAMCHGIESFWSVRSTLESREYAGQALQRILEYQKPYLDNDDTGNAEMLRAANCAGKAINLSQTTAGHAMSYPLTSLYGIAHGHAAALCVCVLWPHLHKRLPEVCRELAGAMGCFSSLEAEERFCQLLADLHMDAPQAKWEDIPLLAASVNQERLQNHPVQLTQSDIAGLYRDILMRGETT